MRRKVRLGDAAVGETDGAVEPEHVRVGGHFQALRPPVLAERPQRGTPGRIIARVCTKRARAAQAGSALGSHLPHARTSADRVQLAAWFRSGTAQAFNPDLLGFLLGEHCSGPCDAILVGDRKVSEHQGAQRHQAKAIQGA